MAISAQSYTVRLRKRGQLTIPRPVCNTLATQTGELLTLIQIDDLLVLTPHQMRLSALTDNFTAEMKKANVSLADLLQGLAEVRGTVYQERQGGDTE